MAGNEPEPTDEEVGLIQHEITIRLVVQPDGQQVTAIRFMPDGDDYPPLLTVIGLLGMANNTAFKVYEQLAENQ